MKMWLSVSLLLAGLCLSSAAPTVEECAPLLKQLPLEDPTTLHGEWNFIMGFVDNPIFEAILKVTESSKLNITHCPHHENGALMTQLNRMNGTCLTTSSEVMLEDNRATGSYGNISSAMHAIVSSEGCMVYRMNTTGGNLSVLLKAMHLEIDAPEEISTHAFYLMCKETTIKDEDLEHFKKQALCAGFVGEPDFTYNPANQFCTLEESLRIG